MARFYEAEGDRGRSIGYNRALTFLKTYEEPIIDVHQLDKVPYVGKKMKAKIEEYLQTGTIKKLEFMIKDD